RGVPHVRSCLSGGLGRPAKVAGCRGAVPTQGSVRAVPVNTKRGKARPEPRAVPCVNLGKLQAGLVAVTPENSVGPLAQLETRNGPEARPQVPLLAWRARSAAVAGRSAPAERPRVGPRPVP